MPKFVFIDASRYYVFNPVARRATCGNRKYCEQRARKLQNGTREEFGQQCLHFHYEGTASQDYPHEELGQRYLHFHIRRNGSALLSPDRRWNLIKILKLIKILIGFVGFM